mmetsp:Transcript_2351/g.3374  ORF Transcript_2351/g.3374 Transcript_2351/m.3374 type:complete len:350 (+) Transcript_2351:44-1093(+)|eukprot:CAMPEP_0171461026 /NCGR_PEP_ID=MMETSP0945-20130129/5649_1 /TAXON_ID=109269 /ORGANISM="Vaucheria litorea, Strain CCMP2940" /LENGTH=349 /DNA_ID=CAMNT_0011987311 /DNA_START=29 /DNA_END=1078 /DNA_ORIENTATION=-
MATPKTEIPLKAIDSSKDSRESARTAKLLDGIKDKSPPWLANIITATKPLLVALYDFIVIASPFLIKGYIVSYSIYEKLPKNVVAMIIGLAFCFFGGFFAVTFAAFEAFKEIGGNDVSNAIKLLRSDFKAVLAANKKDDDEVRSKGIDDSLSAQDLVTRKTMLVLKTVNPEQLNTAVGGLYKGFTGVIVVLKFRFARTIALAMSIAEYMNPLASRFLVPALSVAIPEEYHQWIPTIIKTFCRSIATTVAWRIQRVISTFQSGIKGGLMTARGLVRFMHENKYIDFDDEATYIDEVMGWGLAGCGIYFQIMHGWHLPFLLNIFMFPLHISEHLLIWAVTWMDSPVLEAHP